MNIWTASVQKCDKSIIVAHLAHLYLQVQKKKKKYRTFKTPLCENGLPCRSLEMLILWRKKKKKKSPLSIKQIFIKDDITV